MTIHAVQTTTNFVVQYDDGNAQAQGMATAIAGVCESEFTALTGWFNITTGFGTGDRITMTVQSIAAGGANNYGYQSGGASQINVNFLPAGYTAAQAAEVAKMMFVNELVEIFMSFNSQKGPATWNAGNSDGEGLSQFLGILRFPVGHYYAYGSWANAWLASGRADWVTAPKATDGDSVSFGCALLFLFYLNTQMGFTPAQIIQAGSTSLAGLYANLTGDSSNPFGFFLQLIESALPGTSTIAGGVGQAQDDPFPIFTLKFWDNKNTFGKAEVTAAVSHSRPFSDALLLVLEGFSPSRWQALGSPVPADPSGPAAHFAGIGFNRTRVEFEAAATPGAPQRIHFHYDVGFGAASPGAFTASAQTLELDSSITLLGQTSPAAVTELSFFGAEDPYFSNINPTIDNVPWLSEDLRVFATPAQGSPVPGGPAFTGDSLDGARTWLRGLLTWLNQTYGDPSLTDPFDPASHVIPQQTDALSGDSSVLPNLSFLGFNENIYNFAIARVRLNGAIGDVSNPVKVFFRLWSTQSPDTDYQPGSTYNSQPDGVGLPAWPLPDPDSSTFPFFATGNSPNFADPNNPELGAGGVNSQVITIGHGQGQWTYFGCLLNVYDGGYLVNGTPVTQLLPGTHHCLVAQIAYDDAPIIVPPGQNVSPGNTDKLAQRNLQITPAFNPGRPPTNRVPQTFDLRPTAPAPPSGPAAFDELMIDWGHTPEGSTASLYWPGASAHQVVNLADERYGYHRLTASDAHTLQTPVGRGLTYVPIPPQAGANLASLLTVELPGHVVKGQKFTVIVRRVTTYTEPPPVILKSPALQSPPPRSEPQKPPPAGKPGAGRTTAPAPRSWRIITGAFQVDIPVKADADILPFDENTLAIFKWRLEVMPKTDRWRPVLQRYIRYLSDRIDGLGGDAGAIKPSPTGLPPRGRPTHGGGGHEPGHEPGHEHPHGPHREPDRDDDLDGFRGKVVEVVYDCFGDFEGFVLGCCEGDRAFRSRERGIEAVVVRALEDRTAVEVLVSERTRRIEKLILR